MPRKSPRIPDTKIDDIYTAGQTVPPGLYRLVGSTREVNLDHEDILPASLDGKVAVYIKHTRTWGELRLSKGEKKTTVQSA